jgi:hypothetical protein
VIQVLTLEANAPVSEPKMAARAEMLAGSHDPPINPVSRPFQKTQHYLHTSHMNPRHPNSRITIVMQITKEESSFWHVGSGSR